MFGISNFWVKAERYRKRFPFLPIFTHFFGGLHHEINRETAGTGS